MFRPLVHCGWMDGTDFKREKKNDSCTIVQHVHPVLHLPRYCTYRYVVWGERSTQHPKSNKRPQGGVYGSIVSYSCTVPYLVIVQAFHFTCVPYSTSYRTYVALAPYTVQHTVQYGTSAGEEYIARVVVRSYTYVQYVAPGTQLYLVYTILYSPVIPASAQRRRHCCPWCCPPPLGLVRFTSSAVHSTYCTVAAQTQTLVSSCLVPPFQDNESLCNPPFHHLIPPCLAFGEL